MRKTARHMQHRTELCVSACEVDTSSTSCESASPLKDAFCVSTKMTHNFCSNGVFCFSMSFNTNEKNAFILHPVAHDHPVTPILFCRFCNFLFSSFSRLSRLEYLYFRSVAVRTCFHVIILVVCSWATDYFLV